MPTVLVVQPDDEDPPERLQQWLEEAGIEVRVVRPYAGEPVPGELVDDAVVVLGGDMGAGDVEAYPWLADVMALLRTTVSTGAPTLGVCLGGQLLAAALGGRVGAGEAGMETGVVEVRPRDGASDDRLLAGLEWPLRMITMHRDAIEDLPAGAVWLADSEPYGHQVFRVGEAAWGVQFHPEVSPATYTGWAEYLHDTDESVRRAKAGVGDVEDHQAAIAAGAQSLVRAFAAVVADGAQSSGSSNPVSTS